MQDQTSGNVPAAHEKITGKEAWNGEELASTEVWNVEMVVHWQL